jgi:hypothetical protein
MSTLLLNGCSFTKNWFPIRPDKNFCKNLGCDTVSNIAEHGTSFQRSVRTTIEWIAKNGNPGFVIIPITFAQRWEMCVGSEDHDIEGSWIPMQRKEFIDKDKISDLVHPESLYKLLDLYNGSIPDVRHHWDQCFTNIISLSAFLEHRKINYLMFDMCNNFEKKHLAGFKAFEKVRLIEHNKKIIDLFSFCGNRLMWNSMTEEEKNKTDPYAHHHGLSHYKYLEDYLLKYLQS